MKQLGAIIVILILSMAVLAPAVTTCRLCGKIVSGNYVKFEDGDIYCNNCLQKYKRCDICGKPASSLAFVGDKRICGKCSAKSLRCGICQKPIIGEYVQYPNINLVVCQNCQNKTPKCAICGRPDNNLVRVGGKRICAQCSKSAAICNICGEPIVGVYTCFEGDESRKFCQKCIDKYPRCADCGAPSGPRYTTLADGRMLCSDCYRSALFQPEQITTIKKQVLDYLESDLGIKVTHQITYTLQGKDFILKKSSGLAGDLNGLFYRKNDMFDIYVLYGLRRNDLYQVLAHEIAHAWLSENGRPVSPLEEAEGFAQWVSYHMLKSLGLDQQCQILTAGNDIYANGLKRMLQIERSGGQKAVFAHVTRK